jgi:hypothetical protein
MKRILLALAGMVAAVGALAQATGGTIVFKTYYSATDYLKMQIKFPDGTIKNASTAEGWKVALLGNPLAQTTGKNVGTGATGPVLGDLSTAGLNTATVTWALDGYAQGQTFPFAVGLFYAGSGATTWDNATLKGSYPTTAGQFIPVVVGGDNVSPPVPAGKLTFGGAQTYVLTVPEPSVIALGVLGVGAFFLMRRRS